MNVSSGAHVRYLLIFYCDGPRTVLVFLPASCFDAELRHVSRGLEAKKGSRCIAYSSSSVSSSLAVRSRNSLLCIHV